MRVSEARHRGIFDAVLDDPENLRVVPRSVTHRVGKIGRRRIKLPRIGFLARRAVTGAAHRLEVARTLLKRRWIAKIRARRSSEVTRMGAHGTNRHGVESRGEKFRMSALR